jgi:cation diffusion facilitator family transporter
MTDNSQLKSAYQETQRVSFISATTNALLALLKTIIGFLGQSQALIADGLHSFSDLLADALVLVTSKWANRAPDHDHPYGHKRLETLSSIIIACLLLAIGTAIALNSIHLFILKKVEMPPSIWVISAAILSIIANESLFRYGMNTGKRIHSDLLITNAWHNRSDALSSLIVLLSSIGVYFHLPFLDMVGAILIAILIIKMSIQMIFKATNELIDAAADPETIEAIKNIIQSCEDVIAVHQLRTRLHSGLIFVDTHIIVNNRITVSEGHFIGELVKEKLSTWNKQITDITVHIDSEDDEKNEVNTQLPERRKLIELLQNTCSACPGVTHIQEYQIHYIENAIHCTLVIALSDITSHTPEQVQQIYEKSIKTLDSVSKINILFST